MSARSYPRFKILDGISGPKWVAGCYPASEVPYVKRKISRKLHSKILLLLPCIFLFNSCSSSKPFDDGLESATSESTSYSGYVVVTSVTTDPTTGPGVVSLFKPDGTFYSSLRDLYPSLEWAMGSAFLAPDKILVGIGNGSRIEQLDLTTGILSNFATARISGNPNRVLIKDPANETFYLAEQNGGSSAIEKFDSSGSPIGAPFIPASKAPCSLNAPTGIAYISTSGNIAVIQNKRLNIYTNQGACVATVTASPFNNNTSYGIAYHAQTDKLIVAFASNSAIYACSTLGTGCTSIYLNTSIVKTPRAVTTDDDGNIYIGSSGTDTVEKFTWTGTGQATRVSGGSFIAPGIYSQNPTSIMVIP
jgi:hypothetical protein